LPTGPGQCARVAPRGPAGPRGGGGHGDGQTRPVLPGHPAADRGGLRCAGGRLPGVRGVRDDQCRSRAGLDRPRPGRPGVTDLHPSHGGRHRPDLLGPARRPPPRRRPARSMSCQVGPCRPPPQTERADTGTGGGLAVVVAALTVWRAFRMRAGKGWARTLLDLAAIFLLVDAVSVVVGVFGGMAIASSGGEVVTFVALSCRILAGLCAATAVWRQHTAESMQFTSGGPRAGA